MPVDTRISVPFIPQEGITGQILQALQLANEHHVQQQQIGIQQQQANTQQQGVQQQGQLIPSEIQRNTAGAGLETAQAAGVPAQSKEAQSRADLFRAQADLATATNPLDVHMKQIEVDRAEALNKLFANGGMGAGAVDQARTTLGKLSPTEEAQLGAAENASKFEAAQGRPDAMNHVAQAVNDISNNRRAMDVAKLYGSFRGDIYNKDYLDTENNSLQQLTANEFVKASKENPGRFIEFSPTVSNSLKAQGQVNDIYDGIKTMRSVLNAKDFQLSDTGRTIMAAAQRDPTVLNAALTSEAAKNLTPQERNLFVAMQTMQERAMSLRGLQGQGAGSDAQREAIVRLLPSLFDPDVNMSKQRLDQFQNNVDNLNKQIPRIGKNSKTPASEQTAPPASTGSTDPFAQFGGKSF